MDIKLHTVNMSWECEVEGLKATKRSNPEVRQGDSQLTTSPSTRQGTNEYRPEKTSSATESNVSKRCLVTQSILVFKHYTHIT